ncbi:hypothetical protein B0H13DRAFT_2263342 [Mycena leptocephala]|nr:hypothetical protein B0H13DRAFT_2263342 [Mycena leptocephala]
MASESLTVFFRPRPSHPEHGTNWMPAGFGYGPFHPDHGPLPEDATERLEFMCSSDLVRQWSDFHHTIRPLLAPPKLHYPSCQALYADLLWREDQRPLMGDFWYDLTPSMLKRYRDLCLPVTDPFDDGEIINRLPRLELMSLDVRYIEMKISACIFVSLIQTFVDFRQYSVELRNCCSAWDKLRGVGDYVTHNVVRSLGITSQLRSPDAQYIPRDCGSGSSSRSASDGKSSGSSPELGTEPSNTVSRDIDVFLSKDHPALLYPNSIRQRKGRSTEHCTDL